MVIDLRYDAASICLYSLGAIAGYARGASEIGDDEGGDILNIINSRSDDEGRDGWRGAARIINTAIPPAPAPGASLSLANVSRVFLQAPGAACSTLNGNPSNVER